jgi:hypothetical protein
MVDFKKLQELAAHTEDQTETQVMGDFEYTPPAAGITVARFIEYIELGKRKQKPFQGKAKPDAEEVRLTFELLHPAKNIHTNEETGDKYADRISFNIAKKFAENASFKKLFNAMTYGRAEIKHMSWMLGEAFIVNVVHNVVEKDGKKQTYANLRDDSGWKINAPRQVDALSGTSTDISKSVPEPISPLKLFLWDHPTKETWDSLFIDGTRDVKDDKGAVTQVSKNWLQELILGAQDYKGSALNQLVAGVPDLPTSEPEKPAEKPAEKVEERRSLPAEITDTLKTETPPAASAADDALAALGLV